MLNLNFNENQDLYQEISGYDKKIYIWGTGSVALGVKRKLDDRNIKVDGFFTDVKTGNFDSRLGSTSLFTLDELLESGEKFSVIIGHSHYEYANKLKKYGQIENVWLLAMVARTDICIDKEYISSNLNLFNETYELLADEKSKKNMEAFLNVQLTQNGQYIVDNYDFGCSYFDNDVFELSNEEIYFDIGTYDGTSIDNFIRTVNDNYKKIVGVEVLKNVYDNLIKKYSDERIQLLNIGLSNHKGYDYFNLDDQSTCLVDEKNGIEIEVDTIDNVCEKFNVYPTIVKMCIGNTIVPILEGSKKVLNKLPKLVITAGIDKYALTTYIQKINSIVGEDKYEYYLRYTSAMAECLILIANPKKSN